MERQAYAQSAEETRVLTSSVPLPRLPGSAIHITRLILLELRQAVDTDEYPPVRLIILDAVERIPLLPAVVAAFGADALRLQKPTACPSLRLSEAAK